MSARSDLSLLVLVMCSACLAAHGAAVTHGPYRPGVDVEDYALSLELPERGNVVRGDAVLTVRRTARVDTLVLDLVDLTVDSVRLDGRRTPFARPSGTIAVPLPSGVEGRFQVEVAYHGAVSDGLI